MHKAVDEGNIGSKILLQVQIALQDDGNPPRVCHHQFSASGFCTVNACSNQRMGHGGVGADDEDAVGPLDLFHGVGHCPASKGGGQPGHRG
jgi:hypothetical protein